MAIGYPYMPDDECPKAHTRCQRRCCEQRLKESPAGRGEGGLATFQLFFHAFEKFVNGQPRG